MHYDVAIIGAGMSGLAAGIRAAYFDKRVCILEKHYAYGGLNSYYTLKRRAFDVGLHAVTNYVDPGVRNAPLPKLLRQLRLTRDDFDLNPQRFSEIHFPDRRLRFTNDVEVLVQSVAETFPQDADNFRRFVTVVNEFDDLRLDATPSSARGVLGENLSDPVLIDMLLCPMMYYGSAQEHDMDFTQFVTMFKSIFLQGFARPPNGVRTIIRALVRKYRSCGGELRMRCGVRRIETDGDRIAAIALDSGETITADVVLSSAGLIETMKMCDDDAHHPLPSQAGQVSFVESIAVLDQHPAALGHDATIIFFNDADTFTYAVPERLVDLRSGVVCCPTNYEGHEDVGEGVLRVTWLASSKRWAELDENAYSTAKQRLRLDFFERGKRYIDRFDDHTVGTDMFTPRTIERYTGHHNGAVYGTPHKVRDGRTRFKNLFICGTDQGFLGIIGAMLSGITVTNLHILPHAAAKDTRVT